MKNTIANRTIFVLLSLILFGYIAYISPNKAQLIAYKLSLVSLFAILGYWLDLLLFKSFRPNDLKHDMNENMDYMCSRGKRTHDYLSRLLPIAVLRRALIIFACILGGSLGL
jgi:hypothetical protein